MKNMHVHTYDDFLVLLRLFVLKTSRKKVVLHNFSGWQDLTTVRVYHFTLTRISEQMRLRYVTSDFAVTSPRYTF